MPFTTTSNPRLQAVLCCLLLGAILLLPGCGGARKTPTQAAPPDWLQDRPQAPDAYIGIGRADKNLHPVDFAQIAKRNALSDLASEIKVQIDTRSMLYQIENRDRYREDYQSATRLRAQQNLEGYEQVDSWQNDDQYAVYYRLSKSAYQRQQEARRRQALDRARAFFQQGQQLENQGRYADALQQHLQALTILEPYLGASPDEGGATQLGMEVYQKLLQWAGAVQLRFRPSRVKDVFLGYRPANPVSKLEVTMDGQPYAKAQLMIQQGRRSYQPQTDSRGRWMFQPDRISAQLDRLQAQYRLIDQSRDINWRDHPLGRRMLEQLPQPEAQLELAPQPAWCQVRWKLPGDAAGSDLEAAAENALRRAGFTYTASARQAHYALDLQLSERRQETANDIQVHYLDIEWSLQRVSDGQTLLQGQITDIKGVQLKRADARRQAFRNVFQALEDGLSLELQQYLKAS